MRHRGPIALNKVLSTEHQEFLAGLRPRNEHFAGWSWMADDDDDDDKDDDDADSGSDEDSKKDKDSDDTSGDVAEELARVRRRMEAADKRASEAEKRLKEQDDAKKDDLTKAQEQATELETTVKEQAAEISGLRLQVAFLTANKQNWHDSDVALKLAESQGYLEDVVDEDGKVDKKALKKALERLGKEHPYLIASEDKKDKEPDSPSGESAGRRSDNNKDDKARKEELRKRFPVLNR